MFNQPVIEHVMQSEALNCVSACLSMVLRKDIDVITNEFDNAYHNQEIEMHEYLNAHGIKYRRCMADERKLKANHVYICHVPSLNITSGFHAIVLEMLPCGERHFIHDPNTGRDGRLAYGEHGNVKAWAPDYEFTKADLNAYWSK